MCLKDTQGTERITDDTDHKHVCQNETVESQSEL